MISKGGLITSILCSVLNIAVGLAQSPVANEFKLFLIGDAGENITTGKTLSDLKVQLEANPNSAVIFLGDNCYSKSFFLSPFASGGFKNASSSEKKIMSQLNILRNYNGSVIFIPGNHDWWNTKNLKRGKKNLLKEQRFINDTLRTFSNLSNHTEELFLPKDGDPGPALKVFLSNKLKIILIDTQRLIMAELYKERDSLLTEKFYRDLQLQLQDAMNNNEKVIIAAHHPIYAKGNHSTPLKLYEKIFKRYALSNLNYPPYEQTAQRLQNLLKEFQLNIYYVSGHEHSLEFFKGDNFQMIISGGGSKTDKSDNIPVDRENEFTIWNQQGFFEIDFSGGKDRIVLHHRVNIDSEMEIKCLSGCN